MASSAPASKGARYAPADPMLPKPWRALIDGSTGYKRPVGCSRNEERARNSGPSESRLEAVVSRSQYAPSSDNRTRSDHSEPRSAAGVNVSQSAQFTNQVSQVANGSQMSIEEYCAKHEITIIGNQVPAPFMTFQSTGFPPEILREVLQAGLSAPTPIQALSWPIALKGRDIVAVAKTGSGKTLGYLLPGFILLKRLQHNSREGPTVLVLSPTRELATQIQDEAIKFGRSSRISSTCLYEGAPEGTELRELDRGVDIVVATPGRLNDILERNRVSLRQVLYLVLDEVDRMLDMGFEPQIRTIMKQIPPKRQTLMYTATWPKEVRKIASHLLVDDNRIRFNIGSINELVVNKSITQHVEVISGMEKSRRLDQILRSQEPGSKIIIFCTTKSMCDQLARNLSRQYGASASHGDKSEVERDSVLRDFRSGRCPVLIATDVGAARCLDIQDVRVVVNYDFPTGVEDYVHRIGRTGRAGATGSAYTFFCYEDSKYASDLVRILEGANQSVPPELKQMALCGGYGRKQLHRWASSNEPYEYGSGRLNESFNNSSFGNQATGGSSFQSSFHNSTSGSQYGDILSFHDDDDDGTLKSPLNTSNKKRGSNTTDTDTATSSPKKHKSPMFKCMKGLIDTIQSGNTKEVDVAKEIQEHITNLKKEEKRLEEQQVEQEIERCMELVKECGATEETEEFYVATMLFAQKYNRTVFSKLTTNAGRMAWLKKCSRDWRA